MTTLLAAITRPILVGYPLMGYTNSLCHPCVQISSQRSMCIACEKGRVDIKGEQQVTCAGRGGLIRRHDSVRDLIRQQVEKTGFVVEIEKNANSDDRSRPGDLKIIRWKEGRDLYVDYAIINPEMAK